MLKYVEKRQAKDYCKYYVHIDLRKKDGDYVISREGNM